MLPQPYQTGLPLLPPISQLTSSYSPSNNNATASPYSLSSYAFFEKSQNYYLSNNVPYPIQEQNAYVCIGEPVEHPTVETELRKLPSLEELNNNNMEQPLKKAKIENRDPIDNEEISQASFANVTNFKESGKSNMKRFSENNVLDFKHVIYNCLVDNFNEPEQHTFVQNYTIKRNGITRHGFRFNESMQPEKRVPELYARHIRKARLELQDQSSVFIQDLYKFYLRACIELLSKYFEKVNRWTYLYEDVPLFVPNGSLKEAEERIKTMKTRTRKKKAEQSK